MFYPTAQSITLTYLPDMAVANGIPRDKSASIISICGITNTIGRILAGFLTDSFHVSSTTIYLVALTVAAVTNFLFPWCYNYLTVALCSGVFGLCMGKLWVWLHFNYIVFSIEEIIVFPVDHNKNKAKILCIIYIAFLYDLQQVLYACAPL